MGTVSSGSRALVGLLSEPVRLKVVSALALGATTPSELVRASGLEPRDVAAALRRLEAGGLVSTEKGEVRLHEELFKDSARAEAPPPPTNEQLSADAPTATVLRAFTRAGRIVDYPISRAKRLLLLTHIASIFEPGVRYAERDVNAMLRAWHDDHARLRRYLVDAGLLDRADGVYWRIGGWVDTEPPPPPEPTRRPTRVAAYGLVQRGEEVLLTQLWSRTHPHAGRWTLPGGGVDYGERPADAVVREVYEETGYAVRVTGLLDVDAEQLAYDRDGVPVLEHPVRAFYRMEITGGTMGVVEVGGSTVAVAWWPRSALPEPITSYSAGVVERFSAR